MNKRDTEQEQQPRSGGYTPAPAPENVQQPRGYSGSVRKRRTEQLTCTWHRESSQFYDLWHSGCGREWELYNGGPNENNMAYCPFCGRRIHEEDSNEQA